MIDLKEVSFSYGEKIIFDKISLSIKNGEIVSILGKSGCGKSTLLKVSLGELEQKNGNVALTGKTEYLSQDEHLFPYLTALENLQLPVKLNKQHTGTNEIGYLLDSFCYEYEDLLKFPSQMSGGMCQKILFMRLFLSNNITNFILDEPYTAIDENAKRRIGNFSWDFFHRNNSSVLIVTHDIEQALAQSDRIIIMKEGMLSEIIIDKDLLKISPQERIGTVLFRNELIRIIEAYL